MTEQPPARDEGPTTSPLPTVEADTTLNPTVSEPTPDPVSTEQTQPVPVQPVATQAQPTQAQPIQPTAPAGPVKPAKAVRRPLGTLPALIPGIVLSVVAVGIGVVGVHDALVHWTRSGSWDLLRVNGPTWTGAAIHWIEQLTPQLWMTFAGAALVLLGISLVVLALKPRRVRGVAVTSSTYMWVEQAGVGRLAVAAAAKVPGVRSARGSAGRRTVKVTVDAGSGDSQALATSVRDTVAVALTPLARTPRITVSVKQPDQPPATPGSAT